MSIIKINSTENTVCNCRQTGQPTMKVSSQKLKKSMSIECIKNSIKCGCYYCCSIFNPSEAEIDEKFDWIGCPHCGIDSVVGDFFELKITKTQLRKIKQRMFRPRFYASYEITDIGRQVNENKSE